MPEEFNEVVSLGSRRDLGGLQIDVHGDRVAMGNQARSTGTWLLPIPTPTHLPTPRKNAVS